MPLNLSKLQNVKATSDGWVARCPVCHAGGGDSTGNHLRVWKDGRWSCIIAPGDKQHNKSIWGLVGDGADSDLNWINETSNEQPIEIDVEWEMSALDRLVKDYSYWENRGISQATIEPFNGGMATVGKMANRWVIPIFNNNDKIIGFTGRRLDKKPEMKWKHVGKVGKWVWGGLSEIEESKRIILVESPADLLSLREKGQSDCLCLFGVNLSQSLLAHIIAANPEKIIISTNNDLNHDVGQKAAGKIKTILDKFFDSSRIEIRLPQLESCKDWNDVLLVNPDHIKETFQDTREL